MIEVFFKGGPVMFPLLLCSLISLTVIIERAIFWITVDIRRNEPKAEEVLTLFQNRDLSRYSSHRKGHATGKSP
jgi:biopolymer transport protein ExbB